MHRIDFLGARCKLMARVPLAHVLCDQSEEHEQTDHTS